VTIERLFTNACIATMTPGEPYGLIGKGAVGVSGGKIMWIGAADDLPPAELVEDCGGRLITPGLIDCHTHLVYDGSRAREFEARLSGARYEDIAKAGGGILSTVNATRAASEDDLVESALPRLDRLIAEGVCDIEIKSGYGLDLASELKILRAARRLGRERNIHIHTTFLGAHATPPEFDGRPDDYIAHLCNDILPAAHQEKLVDAVDGFCEGIGFTAAQIERVFQKAQELGLPVKLHAEQLSERGGARLAARYHGLSADHLEYLNPDDAPYLAAEGTIAVLLPGAFYYLRETRAPPVEALRRAGVAMAVATDCNPGTSPMTSILLAMNMACTLFHLTPQEALAGCTANAARALGIAASTGTLAVGKGANLAIWNAAHPSELAYHVGFNPLYKRIFEGH